MNEAQRNERRLDRLVRWLFGHRHKWEPYRLLGNNGRTVFYCRECECGKKQIQNAGPMGDGKWQDLVPGMNLSNDFENEWLRGAVRMPPNNQVERPEARKG